MATIITASCDCGWTGGPYPSRADAQRALDAHDAEQVAALQRHRDGATS